VVAGCLPDEEVCNPGTGICESLYACETAAANLDKVNLTTWGILSTVTLSDVGGGAVGGCNGLATDPTTGTTYVVVNDGSGGSRRLGTVDVATGSVTVAGMVGDTIAGIAFDETGTLYGMSGQFAMTTNALYTIDTATGNVTLVVDVANEPPGNTDGESIAYSPVTGLVYRWSGNGSPKWYSSIDPGTMIETSIPPSLLPTGEVLAATFFPGGPFADAFLISTLDNEAISVQTDGTYANLGSFAPASTVYKGLALVPN